MDRVPNPILGPNKFKFGLFNANCDGGFAISKAPERWRCDWDDVVKACVMADEAGIDFILPVAADHHEFRDQQRLLVSNCFAQSAALMHMGHGSQVV